MKKVAALAVVGLFVSGNAMAWDLSKGLDALKKVQQVQNGEAPTGTDPAPASAKDVGNPPMWHKLFFSMLKNQKGWDYTKVVNQYWMAKPDSTYDKVKDNEFEYEGQKQKMLEELKSSVASFKPETYDYQVFANLGKYDFTKGGYPLEELVNEDNLVLTQSKSGGVTQAKPSMSVSMNPIPQEESWQTVPTGFLFKVDNPNILKFVKVEKDLAKKYAETISTNRDVEVRMKFDVVKIDAKDKKYMQSGTVGVAYVHIVSAEVYYVGLGFDKPILFGAIK